MNLEERLKKTTTLPECLHLNKDDRTCKWISQQLGKPYGVTPIFCNVTCDRTGPHCGKTRTDEEISEFIYEFLKRSSPAFNYYLAEKVYRHYKLETEIEIPIEYETIKDTLKFLSDYEQFIGILLTGSLITKRDKKNIKDYDIVLCFSDVPDWLKQELNTKLPDTINGVKTDYFIESGLKKGEAPPTYFVCMDVENKILYSSSWFKLNLKSIPADVKFVERENKEYGKALKRIMEAAMSTDDHFSKRVKWGDVKYSWENAGNFLEALKSRGIVDTVLHVIGVNDTLGNRVDEETYKKRVTSCFGDATKNIAPCFYKVTNCEGVSYCNACGCGQQKLAQLNNPISKTAYTKLHHPDLKCPLAKEGFSNHVD